MEFWLFDHSSSTRTTLSVEAQSLFIGRDEECQIVLRGGFIARRHARIYFKGNQIFIENLSQSSLVVANREVLSEQPVKLDFGDEIQIAQYSLALLKPGRKAADSNDRYELQRKLMAFEQQVHAELLDRLNLRIAGGINKGDKSYVEQILVTLDQVLEVRVRELGTDLMNHTLHTHLHRAVIAEVVRQCHGKVQTEYRQSDDRLTDPARERAIWELVGTMVDQLPLLLEPASVQDDLLVAEEGFDDLFNRNVGSVSEGLRQYIVRRTVTKDLQDIMFGLGPLQDLLEMANVSEIMVVGKDRIYIEKNGVIQPTTRSFFSDEILLSVIERILTAVGRRVDTSNPLVDARLPDGSRVNAIIPPLSLAGPCLTIRKFSWIPFAMDDLIARGSVSGPVAAFLQGCVLGRQNIIVSGGTGSGKTTLLNVLSAFARPSERIITIEESAELRLPQPHVVPLEGRPANVEGRGAYTIRELVKNALRMRPDRIIVGEVRGPEALDMLQAMNTGHDGSLSTIHANAPAEACQRLETLVLMAVDMPVRAIREQIVSAVDLIVHVARFPNGRRRITHVSEVVLIDQETGQIQLEDIFTLKDADQPRLRHTGYVPTFAQEMIARGNFDVKAFL